MKAQAPALPYLLAVAAKAAGIDAVLKAARSLGGQHIYIPKTAAPNHPLVLAMGQAAADAICNAIGGEHVEFPKGAKALQFLIAEELIAKHASANEMATVLKVSYRQARRLRNKVLRAQAGADGRIPSVQVRRRPSDPRQMDLISDYLAKAGRT